MSELKRIARRVKRTIRPPQQRAASGDGPTLAAALQRVQQAIGTGQPPQNAFGFTFIVGASGSGTTLLTKILSHPANTVCLGGKYRTVAKTDGAAWTYLSLFNRAITMAWDRHASAETHDQAASSLPYIVELFLQQPPYDERDHIIYKRSAPFNPGDRYRPDLSDLYAHLPQTRVVLIYRDPRAATYSSFRREFAPTLRQCAVICEEQLTYLAAQLSTFSAETYTVIPYEAFCRAPHPFATELAAVTGLDIDAIRDGMDAFQVSPERIDRWRQELDASDAAFLDAFFDKRRCGQWAGLTDRLVVSADE